MSQIYQFPTPIPMTNGNYPQFKLAVFGDNLNAVITPGYLNAASIAAGIPLSNSDVIFALYNYNLQTTTGVFGIFTVSIAAASGLITLSLNSAIKTATVTLTQTQVQAMYATPQLIVPAPGTGLAVIPTACQIVTLTSTVFAGGGAAQLQWGNTNHAGGTLALDATTPAAEITAATSQVYTQYGIVTTTATPITTVNGLGLYFTNATGAFTGGAGSTVTVCVAYMVVPV